MENKYNYQKKKNAILLILHVMENRVMSQEMYQHRRSVRSPYSKDIQIPLGF
jgi:hypothetical protein